MRALRRPPLRRCLWHHAAAFPMSTGPAGQRQRGGGCSKRPRADDLFLGVHRDNINIPNALSVGRIAACPFLAWAVVTGHYAPALGGACAAGPPHRPAALSPPRAGFLAAGFLDWIDGYLARKWDQKVRSGGRALRGAG